MSNRITYLILCIFISQWSTAQIADGSVAPNIIGVDLEGNKYDIYEILDSGKGVVIEISATWCSPCWTVHQTHFLDLIHKTYGPEGTDELVVLFLEGDDQTDLADLDGTGDFTVGDWTYCTTVPILDNMASAKNDYQIAYWGTYFVINPKDKTTKWFDFFNNSELKPYLDEIGIIDLPERDASMGFWCDEGPEHICSEANTFVPQLELYNMGSSTLDSLSIDIFVDEKFHSTEYWTGNIPTFKKEAFVLQPISVKDNSKVSVVINQTGDSILTNNVRPFVVQKSIAATFDKVTVEIKTDNFGQETYWHIEDENGNIVASGGNTWVGITNIGIGFGASGPQTPEGTYKSNHTYSEIVNLESPGCYSFVITDYYGGGIRDDLGSYKVTDHSGNVLFSGAEFDDIVVHPFYNAILSNTDDAFKNINLILYPNPVHDLLNISMDITQADISIFDMQGRKVYQNEWDQKPIKLSEFSSGLYILSVSTGTQIWNRLFTRK
jgi:Secretion system C-terminal sorting domain